MSHFEINVAHNGKHLFATHERSARTVREALRIMALLVASFPPSEGYTVNCTEWETRGTGWDLASLSEADRSGEFA
jgi:hypothetical protein